MSGLFSRKQKNPPTRREIARERQAGSRSSDSDESFTFRRNVTITGSASSTVTTLNESGSQLKSPRVHAHHLTRKRRHVGLTLIGVMAMCAALFFLLMQFTARASITINNDASIESKADYQATIGEYYNRVPLERLRFATNVEALAQYVRAHHPEIATLRLDGSDGLGVSHVSLTARRPVAGWNVGGRNEFVDEHGVGFSTNYYKSPRVKIVDNSGLGTSAGKTITSNSFLSFVGQVVGAAASLKHITVTQIIIPPNTTRQVEVRVKGVSYPIKFSTDRSAGEQVEDMARALAWLRSHGNPSLSYVDVRVSGRAFYRPK